MQIVMRFEVNEEVQEQFSINVQELKTPFAMWSWDSLPIII